MTPNEAPPRGDAPVAVVTGASRGLGAGMAAALAGRGMAVGLCARSRPDAPPGRVLTASVDVTDPLALDEFASMVIERFGRIDLWVNNAGILEPVGPLADADPMALRNNVEINVLGVLHGSATFARHVRSRPEGGVLVNMSSGAAVHPYSGWAAYGGSKAAVEMITEVIAEEERSAGLRAYALSPGLVDTDMQAMIRSTSPEAFPAVSRFHQAQRDRRFNSPTWITSFVVEQLLGGTATADHRSGATADTLSVRIRVPDEPRGPSGPGGKAE